jgi:hypothetical protein
MDGPRREVEQRLEGLIQRSRRAFRGKSTAPFRDRFEECLMVEPLMLKRACASGIAIGQDQ